MSQKLLAHMRGYIEVSESDFKIIDPYFESKSLAKKQYLLNAGDFCDQIFFVVDGCLNMDFVTEKGIHQTAQFALANWWISDFLAFTKNLRTEFSIQAVEDSHVLALSRTNLEKLSVAFPPFDRYLRTIYQIGYGASFMRLKTIYSVSKAERYHRFVQRYPDFAQRVPQYLLASFLGLTPEYVSELRGKKRS